MLFLITDKYTQGGSYLDKCLFLSGYSSDIKILYRDKDATAKEYETNARFLSKCNNNALIVHSDIALANELKPWALHLTFDDYIKSRDLKKPYHRIGVSVHSLEELKVITKNNDTEYVLISHIFKTKCKANLPPKGLSFVKDVNSLYDGKIIALGGMNFSNFESVIDSGANGVAIMSLVNELKTDHLNILLK